MNRASSVCRAAVAAVVLALVARQAFADPPDILRDYRFIPAKTTVHVTGGSSGYNMNLTIAGKFGLVTGYDEEVSPTAQVPTLVPHAEFVDVHAILYNPLSAAPLPVPGWDLDKTLNLSGLKGTFSPGDPNDLFFLGADGQGVAIRLQAAINGGFLHLTGGTSDPPSSNALIFQIDALAHLTPFPDFNADGAITAADLPPMLAALANLTTYKAQHNLSDDDFLSMADLDGDGQVTNRDIQGLLDLVASQSGGGAVTAVPEPASMVLLELALPAFAGIARKKGLARRKRQEREKSLQSSPSPG
jgi:hypothetical protein